MASAALVNKAGVFRKAHCLGFRADEGEGLMFFLSLVSCFLKVKTCNAGNHNVIVLCVIISLLCHVAFSTEWPTKLMRE